MNNKTLLYQASLHLSILSIITRTVRSTTLKFFRFIIAQDIIFSFESHITNWFPKSLKVGCRTNRVRKTLYNLFWHGADRKVCFLTLLHMLHANRDGINVPLTPQEKKKELGLLKTISLNRIKILHLHSSLLANGNQSWKN